MTHLLLLYALVAVTGRDAAQAPPADRFAIVVGQDRSNDPAIEDLRYADDDAVATHELLQEAGVRSILLTRFDADTSGLQPAAQPDGPPTIKALRHQLGSLFRDIAQRSSNGHRTELMFFFSGHGDVDAGEGYVTLEDGRLSRTELLAFLERSPATFNHVIIDACRSYFLVFDKGPGGARRSRAAAMAAGSSALRNTGFILSTSSDRESHEWQRFRAGVFSHEVRSALRGAADANQDSVISYGELGAFIRTANQAIPNPDFRPDATVIPPKASDAELAQPVLTWPSESASRLSTDPAIAWGHFYVEDGRGERILDAHPRSKEGLRLQVPQTRPLFVRSADEKREIEVASAGPLVLSIFEEGVQRPMSKGALNVALGRLFEGPFGHQDVLAFEGAERNADRDSTEAGQRAVLSSVSLGDQVRAVSPWVALGCVALGAAATAVALERQARADESSQVARMSLNGTIDTMNAVAITSYVVAAVAGATWGLLTLLASDEE